MKKALIIIGIVVLVLGSIGASVVIDMKKAESIVKLPSRPEEKAHKGEGNVLYSLAYGEEVDWDQLDGTITYLDGRYDTADFTLPSTLRILFDYRDDMPEETYEEVKRALLGFKYWMDQPGEDSTCYWSENHQLLGATGEYLVGQMWPEEVFSNDGLSGEDHKEIAKERLNIWFEQRFLYGYVEWYSNVYYVEDIAPLSVLVEFAEDEEIVTRAKMMLDILLHDVATQSYYGTFTSNSGRMYENGKMSGIRGNSMREPIEHIWGFGLENAEPNGGMDLNFILLRNYEVPEVIKAIGYDHEPQVIKATTGLNLSELKGEGLNGTDLNQVMMQWAMESFTNPEIITNTIEYIDEHNMFSNEFLYDFNMINLSFLKTFRLLPLVSRILNPVTNGVSIQRANTYNYRTEDFMLATAQGYHPGEFGDQQHLWSLVLDDTVSIFTTHPAKALGEGALSNSPGYWVGNGRNPHTVQDENINMSIYKIGDKKGFMEKSLVHFTHANFPTDLLDEVILEDNFAFGRLGDKYVAMVGLNELRYTDRNLKDEDTRVYDLIQEGETTFWITEASTSAEGSFEDFMNRIKSNEVEFDESNLQLSYTSSGKTLDLEYKGDFKVNDEIMDLEYERYESKYSSVERKAPELYYEFNGHSLYLDFYNNERIVS